MAEKIFDLKQNGTNVKTEMLAGITTFMTMAYILVVNPSTLAAAGMDQHAVFTATCLSAIIGTLFMALFAKLPFALAPGMGLNAFFAYSVVLGMGVSWEFALTAVLLEGLIFILLTFCNIREAIINAIPLVLKKAVSVGIGLFIAFIGLYNSKIVITGTGIPLQLGHVTGGEALVAIIGILITALLLIKNVKGALLIGIVTTTIIGIPMGVTTIPENFNIIAMPPSIAPIMFKFEFSQIFTSKMFLVLFTFLFVDMFDTVGTLVGVSTKANMLDEDGKVPNAKMALFADAIGTTVGACLGTSTVTTFVESAAGVSEGGRTGLTALSAAGMFAIALFLSPVFAIIPNAATAPALILVGLFMMSPIREIDFNDYSEGIPAFFTIIMMPLAYSIAEGIVFGMISYVVVKVFARKYNEISPLLYVLCVLFLVKFFI